MKCKPCHIAKAPVIQRVNPDGNTPKPIGFTANPLGFTLNPTGFTTNPVGYTTNPIVFISNPVGFALNLIGFTANPIGFMLKPTGFETFPGNIETKPAGNGARLMPRFHLPPERKASYHSYSSFFNHLNLSLMIRIIAGFSHETDSNLAIEAQHIVNSLNGNESFPTPDPALTDVQTAVNDYTDALAKTAAGGKEFTALKKQKRKALEALLSSLAAYVQKNCNNDPVIALSSGFPLAKVPAPVGMLGKPKNLKAAPGMAGQVLLSVNAVRHAVAYLWQYKLITETVWIDVHTTKSKTAVEGLTSGLQYSFRVSGMGTNPAQNWSDEVRSFVL